MHLILLTHGHGGSLATQHVHFKLSYERPPAYPGVHLLLLDMRQMSPECFVEACAEVSKLQTKNSLRLGVILCQNPSMQTTIAAMRCGVRDMVKQFAPATQIRDILRRSCPGIRLRDFHTLVEFMQTFGGVGSGPTSGDSSADTARRELEIARRANEQEEAEKRLQLERDALSRREQEIKERTRRLDRQLAKMQSDNDTMQLAAPPPSSAPFADLEAMSQRLDQRANELDMREKLLTEMQNLLLTTPAGAVLKQHL